jgi:hypothetical protein
VFDSAANLFEGIDPLSRLARGHKIDEELWDDALSESAKKQKTVSPCFSRCKEAEEEEGEEEESWNPISDLLQPCSQSLGQLVV